MSSTESLNRLHAFPKIQPTLTRQPRSKERKRTPNKRRPTKNLRKQKVTLTPLNKSPRNRRPSQARNRNQRKAHPSANPDLQHVGAAQARAGGGEEALHACGEEAVDDAEGEEAIQGGYADPGVEEDCCAEGYGDEG